MNKRVVITGISTINPLGDNLDDYYNNLIAGKSGVKKWESLDLSVVECKIGGDIGDYDYKPKLNSLKDCFDEEKFKIINKLLKGSTFTARLGSLCAMEAYKDAGLYNLDIDPFITSLYAAGHNFNDNYVYQNSLQYLDEPEFIQPLSSILGVDTNIPGTITEILGLHGPTSLIGGACASGNLAMRIGFRDILTGECERSIITGSPFDVSPPSIMASSILQAVVIKPELQDTPEIASRPFDRDRAGFVYSHGAATIILEDLEVALKRGARIYGEVLSVKANANANHLPTPLARIQARAMFDAIKMAGIKPKDIDYINCHAASTPVGDMQEILAVKEVFGDHAYKLKLNAPKSMLGHTCWASPLVETIAGLLQMKNGILHPSVNIDNLDPEIDLDVCANRAVEHKINYMLKNSFGFGGLNCITIIKRYEE